MNILAQLLLEDSSLSLFLLDYFLEALLFLPFYFNPIFFFPSFIWSCALLNYFTLMRLLDQLDCKSDNQINMRSSLLWMRSSLVVRASGCPCKLSNGPGFKSSIRWHSGIWGAADEAVLNTVHEIHENPTKSPFLKINRICLHQYISIKGAVE